MKTRFYLALIALSFFFLTVPATVQAMTMGHGGVYTAKYIDGANLILLNVNADQVESGVPITYNLRLYDMTGQPILFQKAILAFTAGDTTVHQATLPMSPNQDVGMRYALPKQGTYEVQVQFIDHDKQISQAAFPIVAAKGPNQSFFATAFTAQTAVAFILGAGAVSVYYRRSSLWRLIRLTGVSPKRK